MTEPYQLKYFNQAGLAQIPEQLRTLPQAITWVAGAPDPVTGKFIKRPKGLDGSGVDWPNPEQWIGTFTEALQQAQERVIDGLITEQKPEYLEHAAEQARAHVG